MLSQTIGEDLFAEAVDYTAFDQQYVVDENTGGAEQGGVSSNQQVADQQQPPEEEQTDSTSAQPVEGQEHVNEGEPVDPALVQDNPAPQEVGTEDLE